MAELAAVIVGAGFSGLCAGIQLRRAGIEQFAILEQAAGVGGTWRDNVYPGAACDIPSHLYSYLYWLLESRVLGFAFAPKINQLAERLARSHLERSIRDPELRRRLAPSYRLGCKRVLISNDYYPALARPNVELVTDGIDAVEPAGIRTADGRLREVDTIIFGTGFRVADYVSAMAIRGRGGRELNEVWRDSVRNYLGITVSGFPNLFLLMGPNTGLGHNSMIFMIEAQVRYAVSAILAMHRNGLAELDVRPEVEQAFRAEMGRKLANTVWTSGCSSWYMAPGGDVLLWPGFTFDYWRRTRRVRLSAYATRALAHARMSGTEPISTLRIAV